MKRIRIGNDIRVQTSLHDLNDFDITSIKQLRCYFIPQGDSYTVSNTDTYDPMQYTICNCGKPKYNVFPCNMDAPHWFCGYNGFGVNSKRFVHVDSNFLAPARLLAEQNRIEAYFPAKAQYQIGEYKFVIVLTIYQPGWCENNLRTITLDEGVIFALTNDDRDPDHSTTIDLDITYAESIDVPDKLYLYKTLDLGKTDEKLTKYDVTIGYSDESTRKLTRDEFSEYVRTTVVNNIGTIRVKNDGQIVNDDIYSYVDANVTYSLRKGYNEDPVTKTIRVLSDGKMYKISYHCPSTYLINSNNEGNQIYISDDMQNQKLPLMHFTISKQPGANPAFLPQITGVTATNCTLKYDESNKLYNIYAPVTGNIDITVNTNTDYMETYFVDYTTATDLRVEGDDEINPMHSEISSDKQFGSFTVFDKRSTKNLGDIIVTADGCVVKEISRDTESIKYGINGPITANDGEIKINCTLKETPKPVDKEYTYTINYYYNDEQCTIEGPSEIKVLDSKRFLNEKIGSFYVTCIGDNPNSSNIKVAVTGCTVDNSAGDETSSKYDLYGPITTTNGIINVNISIESTAPHITSITVPNKLTLEDELQFNIGKTDYDDIIYTVMLNYSDGSSKSVTADEFNNLISPIITLGSGISIEDNGQITRTDKFKDIDTEITYQLKENPDIEATMQVVSVGKWHTINYVHSGVVKVEGPTELFVNKDYINYPDDKIQLSSFTATKEPGATTLVTITGATGDGCTVKQSTQDQNMFYICTPIIKDDITITVTNSSDFIPDVDEEKTVTSIVVPNEVTLTHTSHLNIGDLGYDGAAYNIRINYSDGSYKLVSADEFNQLITAVTIDNGNIVIGNTGMIGRLDMYSDVDEKVTYQLKEDTSIKDTMRIVSSGKSYNIKYNYDSNHVTVDGKTSVYIEDVSKNNTTDIARFTVTPTNKEYSNTCLDMQIIGANLRNKPDKNSAVTKAEVTIESPVTQDNITVTIFASQFVQ